MTMPSDPRTFLSDLFLQAVAVADPMRVIPDHLPSKPAGRVVVIGAGKASARMAEAVEAVWGPCEGLVITRYGYARPTQGIEIIEAAHPVPDAAGAEATARMLDLVASLGEDDFVLALMSGGASSLLVAPAGEIALAEKQGINAALLASGAPIDQMNTLRKHLSCIKGGQLAAASYPAHMLSLMISDVPGDDPAFIGSGPTVADDTQPRDATAILQRWSIEAPQSVTDVLAQPSRVISSSDHRLDRVRNVVIAAPSQSLNAAADMALAAGCTIRHLGDALEGEARDVARSQAKLAVSIQAGLNASDGPVLLVSGGELTVTRRGDGVGGPNAEFCLALALALDGAPGISAIAGDTDGVDGAAEVAGALVFPDTLDGTKNDAETSLAINDSHGYFGRIGAQVVTGPTLTNVNDFRAILIQPL